MDRVETVVDQALATGLYVVVNAHHDSWIWADPTASGANITMINEKFGRLWSQIGTRLACKSSRLIFEPLNEPVGSTQANAEVLNNLSAIFLQEINAAGGHNAQRVVSLSGLGMDSIKTSEWFVRPSVYPNQPWGLQFHYYSPYDFVFDAWGKTIWGSDADKASLLNDFTLFHGNFTDVPAFVGEWDSSTTNNEEAARWKYFDYFIRTANSFKYSTILWDNGLDQFNRSSDTWYDPIDADILFAAVSGITNTLADSTTDPSATSQNSSAYLFHKVGDPVVAQSVPYLLNGNTLKSINTATGKPLSPTQYSMSSTGSLTLSASYLSTLYTTTATAGIKETLTLTFSAGSPLTLTVVQYATPIIPTTSYVVDPSADLYIPVTYQGLPQVAAVKAMNADGTYFIDSWTEYLGPLQQARWTYGDWGWDDAHFIVYEAGLSLIQAANQTVTLTVEVSYLAIEFDGLG
jgi:endoglucanase